MADTVTLYLPLNSYISVNAFTNAAFTQRVTITQENGDSKVLTGSGEHNTPMPGGSFSITTPGSSSNPAGYQVTVKVESDHGGGNWVPSQVTDGQARIAYYNILAVVSEDSTDNDWNDAVVQFTWWTAPGLRSKAR